MSDVRHLLGALSELRFDAGTRTLSGRAVPYGETVRIGGDGPFGFDERFVMGAFARSISERVAAGKVKLFAQHGGTQGHMPVGQVVAAREEPSGLYIDATLSNTTAGRDTAELIRTGVTEGLSVGFRPVRERAAGGVREVTEAVLLEVSVVHEAAYPSAKVLSLRHAQRELDELAGLRSAVLPGGRPVSLADRELTLWELT